MSKRKEIIPGTYSNKQFPIIFLSSGSKPCSFTRRLVFEVLFFAKYIKLSSISCPFWQINPARTSVITFLNAHLFVISFRSIVEHYAINAFWETAWLATCKLDAYESEQLAISFYCEWLG